MAPWGLAPEVNERPTTAFLNRYQQSILAGGAGADADQGQRETAGQTQGLIHGCPAGVGGGMTKVSAAQFEGTNALAGQPLANEVQEGVGFAELGVGDFRRLKFFESGWASWTRVRWRGRTGHAGNRGRGSGWPAFGGEETVVVGGGRIGRVSLRNVSVQMQ